MELTINSAARFHCASDWSWDTVRTPMADRDLWTVLAGRGALRCLPADLGLETQADGRRYTIGRGDVFVFDGTTRIVAEHDRNAPLTVVAVHFEGGGRFPFHVRVAPVEFLAGLLDRLLRCRLQADEPGALRWLHAALDEVAATERQTAAAGTDPMHEAIGRLADQIRERPGDDWRVGLLADRTHRSPQHFARLFRRCTGRSPKEYVLEARIEAARAYLRGSSLPIKRIASELGFHDEFHFSRQFSRRVGASPTRYRMENRPAAQPMIQDRTPVSLPAESTSPKEPL